MGIILRVDKLNKTFFTGATSFLSAVKDVSFEIQYGHCFGLVGESGSGKTTIAKMIGGLLTPTSGAIAFLGNELSYKNSKSILERKGIQMIFQNPYSAFSPKMTLMQALSESLIYRHKHDRAMRHNMIVKALEDVGLSCEYTTKRCSELSGGECQRAAIAQALLGNPKMLICDEATSALDVSVQAQIIELLMGLRNEKELSILFISHDIALMSCICDRMAIMRSGELVEIGDTKTIIANPQNSYTKSLLQFYQ